MGYQPRPFDRVFWIMLVVWISLLTVIVTSYR